MKKLAVAVLVAALALGLCACSSSQQKASQKTGGSAQAVSVMEETDADGLVKITNISLPAPAGATDVKYFAYKLDNPLAEMRCTLDGNEITLRAQPTDLLEFPMTGEQLLAAYKKGETPQNDADISGMFYSWDTFAEATVQNRPAQCLTLNGVGIITWLDVVPGVVYSLSMSQNATPDLLTSLAAKVFVPVQGEV